jgi:nickel transport protein
MNSPVFFIAACIVGFSISASAHNAWVVKDSSGFHVVYGHETTSGYDPSKLKEAVAFDINGKKLAIKMVKADSSVALEASGQPSYFIINFDNGFYTKTTEGSKNVSKKGIKEYLSASHSIKYTKSVFVWSDKLLKPLGLGQRVEVVPMSNPVRLKEEDSLSVAVYFEGKPLSGASLNASGVQGTKEKVTTDTKGIAKVKLATMGPSLFAATWKIPLKDDPDADTLSLSGSLFLDLKK